MFINNTKTRVHRGINQTTPTIETQDAIVIPESSQNTGNPSRRRGSRNFSTQIHRNKKVYKFEADTILVFDSISDYLVKYPDDQTMGKYV